MSITTLEERSLWVKYKSKVWPQDDLDAQTAHNIVRTLRSIYQSNLAYLSVPITSGKVLYDELNKTLMSPSTKQFLTSTAPSAQKYAQAPRYKQIIKTVISENYLKGKKHLDELLERTDKPVLFPADLVPRGDIWSQEVFQALWLTIISEHCSELHMSKDWEYSNGAVEEFTHAYQLRLGIPQGTCGEGFSPYFNTKEYEQEARNRMQNITVYDSAGKEISIDQGIESISFAVSWIKNGSFDTTRLEGSLDLLAWTKDRIGADFYQ